MNNSTPKVSSVFQNGIVPKQAIERRPETEASKRVMAVALDPTVIAAGLVLVIGALAAGVVLVINALAKMKLDVLKGQEEINKTARSTEHKADQIIEKAAEIHTLTNSNLSKVTASLDVALEKIAGLEKMVVSLNEAKKVADALTKKPDL